MFNLLKKQSIAGIDISDYSIEVLMLNKDKEVLAFGRTILEEGIVKNGKILNKKKLTEKIKEVLENTQPSKISGRKLKAVLSLPESKTFMHFLKLPGNLNKQDFKKAVYEQSSKIISLDQKNIYWDYMEIQNPDKSSENKDYNFKYVFLAGTLKEIVDEYVEALKSADIEIAVVEPEAVSLGRALLTTDYFEKLDKENNLNDSSMIVDIGARTTIISIFDSRNILNFSVTIPLAGNDFTAAIAKRLKMDYIEAEKLKRSFGLINKKDNLVLSILKTIFQKIIDEINRAAVYYEERSDEKIQWIILAGGSSLLPKIDEYLSIKIGRKIKIGDPLKKISAKVKKNGKLLDKSYLSIIFANVVGLALRGVEDVSAGINLFPKGQKLRFKKRADSETKASFNLNFLKSIGRFLIAVIGFAAFGFIAYQYIYKPFVQTKEVPSGTEFDFFKDEPSIIEEQKDESTEEKKEETPAEKIAEIQIKDTPTGWLNVRKGPGTNFPQITRVNPGEIFLLLEENNSWYKIKIPAKAGSRDKEIEGWIISDYAVKK